MLYRSVVKPIAFRMDPERAHHLFIGGLGVSRSVPGAVPMFRTMYGVPSHPALKTELWGIRFPNPIGLAAGLDKNGEAVTAFSACGFGFMEVGTVTPKPQQGNDLPRLFRLPPDEALINRMGFNNEGAASMAERLKKLYPNYRIPVAVNIGKNKVTPNEQAEEDYRLCIQQLYPYASFLVVNISSPNTPGLRSLQHGEELNRLLQAVTAEVELQRAKLSEAKARPILVKIAPDLTEDELRQTVEVIQSNPGIAGIIATNTTLSRDGLTHPNKEQAGGLSGRPLTKRSTEIIRQTYALTKGKLPIIGCGGIFSAEDAYEKIRAGASLIEIYTALIYKGPDINKELASGLVRLLERDGFTHISQAVGADHHD
ncbi:quinone-dependent dihydroorotate dehydrogenase [Paenibacillus turpanensis]|uniref:quinone-dependent dihydroorotate dehydrogenase n=1 Tax=Paenibacillus turpanensis TaxID=2689078 RepID=UPI0014079326|nr:quinone-dependent dihydroorotate dehydrogenase [Paenibacillus turpanensis]